MASPELASALASLSSASAAEKSKQYNNFLGQVTSSKDQHQADNLIALSDSITSSQLGIISIRPLLTALIQGYSTTPKETKIRVGSHICELLQPQLASYEEQDAANREVLAQAYDEDEEYSLAAKTLQGIQLESTQRQVSDVAKVQTWIRIVRYFLEDDDTVNAETSLNKLKNAAITTQVLQTSPDLQLHYQLSQARILDSRRDFISASDQYFNVSLNATVAEDDRLQALSASIKTAILAPAGPQRSRTLAKLYKDERSGDTEEFGILESMFLDRLLAPAEVEAFAAKLAPHQLALTADGSTVLSKAVLEHNLIATSRLYENISTASLAHLLGLKDGKDETAAEKAEDYAARMVEQQRLKARIDQIDGVITFESSGDAAVNGQNRELRAWDSDVQGLVEAVERCAAAITESFPDLAAQSMVH